MNLNMVNLGSLGNIGVRLAASQGATLFQYWTPLSTAYYKENYVAHKLFKQHSIMYQLILVEVQVFEG